MRASDLLLESQQFTVLPRRKLTSEEAGLLRDFQTVLGLLNGFFENRSRETYASLKANLARLHNLPFMASVNRWLNGVDNHHATIDRSIELAPEIRNTLTGIAAAGRMAIHNRDAGAILRIGRSAKRANEVIANASADPSTPYEKRHLGPMYVQDPLFFQSSNFMRRFQEQEIDEVIALDPDILFTYMDAPHDDNFEYFAYWSLQLSPEEQPAALDRSQYNKWIRITYRSDPNFIRMIKLVEEYLGRNSKGNLPEIIQLLASFPEIKATHDRIIGELDRVYRGVADNDTSLKEVIATDRERKMVATSKSQYVAKNFAMSKGHLDRDGRTDGFIITYAVDRNAIILDTEIFGSIFGESEVVIDVTRARIIDTENVYID